MFPVFHQVPNGGVLVQGGRQEARTHRASDVEAFSDVAEPVDRIQVLRAQVGRRALPDAQSLLG